MKKGLFYLILVVAIVEGIALYYLPKYAYNSALTISKETYLNSCINRLTNIRKILVEEGAEKAHRNIIITQSYLETAISIKNNEN